LSNSASFISIEEFFKKYKHFELKVGDMVVSTSGTLGRVAIIRPSHLPLMLNTSVIRFRPKDIVFRCFMYQYLQSNRFKEELETQASGSVQLNFGPMHLKRVKIISPAINILSSYENCFSNVYDRILLNREQNQELTTLRDTLLPKLISGELEVSQIQNLP
ncbi:MAG: restriction endonuclease subunit S, partial [Chitinophagia bacterium]|nr:restriction endonuclease subunit S [Chitinophagia bacterium]